ncbi:MAG: FAD-dependent oxidoreductase [Bacteroidota bacterium]
MEFDLIVIGAGAAGLSVSLRANQAGLRTALLDRHLFGGECTHSGCIPSKSFIRAAKHYAQIEQRPGNEAFRAAMEAVAQTVDEIYGHETPEKIAEKGIYTYTHPSGVQFVDPHTVSIGDQVLRADHFAITTGSSPYVPELPGISDVSILHNENFWDLRQKPDAVCFIGGGVIAAELSQALARLGVEVHIVERWVRLAHQSVSGPQSDFLQEILEDDGVQVHLDQEAVRFEGPNRLICDRGPDIEADHFFMTLGRRANVQGLNLDRIEIEYDDEGIGVDNTLRTSQPHIYACGDVASRHKYSHMASYQARIVVYNILNPDNPRKQIEDDIPWAIFTEPELAKVGLSRGEVKARYGKDVVEITVPAENDRFITDHKTTGFLTVFFDKRIDQIIGAEAGGYHAAEWIQLLSLAYQQKMTAAQVLETIFIYPTYSEIVRKACQKYLLQEKG